MAICLSDFYTKATSKTLGDVELKHISHKDQVHVRHLVWSVRDDKKFAVQTLFHQLVGPRIDAQDFESLPDDELRQLARDFSRHELRRSLDDTPDPQVFVQFRNAVDNRFTKNLEELSATFKKMEFGISDHLRSVVSGMNYNPTLEALKKMGDMCQEQINSARKNLSELARPKLPAFEVPTFFDAYKAAGIPDIVGFNLSCRLADTISSMSVVEQVSKQQEQVSKSLIETVTRQFNISTQIAFDSLAEQIKAIQSWTSFNLNILSGFAQFWEDFEVNYHVTEEKAVRVLKKYNWFVSPSVPSSFVYEAVRIGRKKGNQLGAINALFWEYFSENNFENLSLLIEGWSSSPLFTRRRIKIIKDCVSALKDANRRSNPCNVVLPTLIAQIDGALTRYKKQKGFNLSTKKPKKHLEELKTWFEAEAADQDVLSPRMLDLANYLFFEILFQSAYHGQPLGNPFTFSRHKIMHGEYLTYGRKDNTVRAFLILDFLAALK
jgi:hypothetical protein